MARTVPDSVAAALRSVVKQPAVALVVRDVFDRPFGSASGGASGRSALLRLGTTGYVRAYVTQPGGGVDATVATQLITDPSDPAQLGSWSTRSTGAAGNAGVALAMFGGTVFLFYQRRSDLAVCYRTSADGLSWSAETVAVSPGVTVWALASSGNDDLFVAQDGTPGNDLTQTVTALAYSAGSFNPVSAWTNPNGRVTGIGAVFDGAARLVLGLQTIAGGASALGTISFAGGAWSSPALIHPIDDAATGLSISYPSVTMVEGVYRAAAQIVDSGVASGLAGSWCELWISPDFTHWRLEQNLAGPFEFGVAAVPGIEAGWLAADASTLVTSTAAAGATTPDLDLSGSLLSLTVDEPANEAATAIAVLDNHDGRLTPPIPPTGAFRAGAQVEIELGYGDDTVITHRLWIEAIETANTSGPERAMATVRMSGRAAWLDRPPPVERIFSGNTLLFLVSEVTIGGGLPSAPSSPGTPQFAETVDGFALSAAATAGDPGETGSAATFVTALRRLRLVYGFDWFVDENETLQLREPLAADPATAAYGPAEGMQAIGHQIDVIERPNQVRVVAPAAAGIAFADAVDFDHQAQTGRVLVRRVSDRLLISSAQARIRAGLELRRAQRDGIRGTISLALNPALQPLDVIAIGDESATVTVRAGRIRWLVDLTAGIFAQEVEVGAP